MSWKPEVKTNDPAWHANACRFATQAEATGYVMDLAMRWTAVTDTRVVPSEDPVNYSWIKERLTPVRAPNAED